jgi:hypothetical protein
LFTFAWFLIVLALIDARVRLYMKEVDIYFQPYAKAYGGERFFFVVAAWRAVDNERSA